MKILTSNHLQVQIYPEFGGMVNSIKFLDKELLDNYCSVDDIKSNVGVNYKGTMLNPWPNRIDRGRFVFENNEFQLPINKEDENNSLHGFVYDKPFRILNYDENKLLLMYKYNGEIEGYPFCFKLTKKYIIKDNLFEVITTVVNTGESVLPFGDGFHPYFKFGGDVDELTLTMPSVEVFEIGDRMIPTSTLLSESFSNSTNLIGNRHFDDGFYMDAVNSYSIESDEIKITFSPDENYDFIQIYTPEDRKSIAIEPMTCAADAFNNGLGLFQVAAGEEKSMRFAIQFCDKSA